MSGDKNGVAAKIKELAPHHISIHAVAHVHQLALGDAFALVDYYADWRAIMLEVYVYYNGSDRERARCTHLLKIKGTHGIRWASSLESAVKALVTDVQIIAADLELTAKSELGIELTVLSPSDSFLRKTFKQKWDADQPGGRATYWKALVGSVVEPRADVAANDEFKIVYRDQTSMTMKTSELLTHISEGDETLQKQPQLELRSKLVQFRFIGYSCFMLDVYSELAILSKSFQSNSLILSDISKNVVKCTRSLKKLIDSPGSKEMWFRTECEKDEGANCLDTCRLELSEDDEQKLQEDRKSTIDALTSHLQQRYTKVLDNPILQAFAVFDHRHRPRHTDEELEKYGDSEINELFKHYKDFFSDTSVSEVIEQWGDLKNEIAKSPGLNGRSFKSLWPHMLTRFTAEYSFVLRLVAIMLVIPLDTSEAERIFSLMNDIKTPERASLGQKNLVNLMIWHYYGKGMKPWDVPVQEILAEFHAMVADNPLGRRPHVAATPIDRTDTLPLRTRASMHDHSRTPSDCCR
eukprot:1940396-Prymnesium_polylepis.1